jgi:hypothetical protein
MVTSSADFWIGIGCVVILVLAIVGRVAVGVCKKTLPAMITNERVQSSNSPWNVAESTVKEVIPIAECASIEKNQQASIRIAHQMKAESRLASLLRRRLKGDESGLSVNDHVGASNPASIQQLNEKMRESICLTVTTLEEVVPLDSLVQEIADFNVLLGGLKSDVNENQDAAVANESSINDRLTSIDHPDENLEHI